MSATRGNGIGSTWTARLEAKDCTATYRHGGRKLAVLTIGRDRDSLAAEIQLEQALAAER
jgi:hypothetical protein